MLCRLLGGPPYSVTIHGPEEFDAPGRWPCARRPVTPPSSSPSATSPAASSAGGATTADWPKIHVVRCGLDGVFLERGPARPSRIGPRLVNVGRLAEQKGQLLLVEAAARLQGPGHGLRAGHRGRRPDARRARAAHRPARPAGPRADHRLPGQPGGPPRAGGRAGPGAAQLRRGAAGGDHGGDGPGPAGDRHVHRRHPGAGRAGPERLAGPGRGRRAAGRGHGRGPERPTRPSWTGWAAPAPPAPPSSTTPTSRPASSRP